MKGYTLITGASSGIGKETVFEYARHGHDLIIVARRTEKLEEIRTELISRYKINVEVITLDLSNIDSAEALFQKVSEKGFRIETLINNAGFGISGNFETNDLKKLEEMMVLNMVTLTKICRLFISELKNSGGGTIINIASTAAFQPVPGLAVYSATKSYVLNFSEALNFELKKDKIKVLAICPGATESEFAQVAGFKGDIANGNIPSSKDLGKYIYEKSKGNCPVSIHGFKNKLMVFSTRLSPRNVVVKVAAMMMK